jgi:hypothetical protein
MITASSWQPFHLCLSIRKIYRFLNYQFEILNSLTTQLPVRRCLLELICYPDNLYNSYCLIIHRFVIFEVDNRCDDVFRYNNFISCIKQILVHILKKSMLDFSCMFPSASCILGFLRGCKEPQKEGGSVALLELLPLTRLCTMHNFLTL